jgi:Na+/H+ antiporter NhaD/arsenite permease-like protein
MWVVGLITFFMSAVLDNLTTTIVMVSLVKKVTLNTLMLITYLIDLLADFD